MIRWFQEPHVCHSSINLRDHLKNMTLKPKPNPRHIWHMRISMDLFNAPTQMYSPEPLACPSLRIPNSAIKKSLSNPTPAPTDTGSHCKPFRKFDASHKKILHAHWTLEMNLFQQVTKNAISHLQLIRSCEIFSFGGFEAHSGMLKNLVCAQICTKMNEEKIVVTRNEWGEMWCKASLGRKGKRTCWWIHGHSRHRSFPEAFQASPSYVLRGLHMFPVLFPCSLWSSHSTMGRGTPPNFPMKGNKMRLVLKSKKP